MIDRRTFCLAGAAVVGRRAVAATLPVPHGDALAFKLVREGSEIGQHTVTFGRQGDTLTVTVAVDAAVSLLSIPIVRYKHRAVETWQGGVLVAVNADTDENGSREWVRANRTAEGLSVLGSRAERYIAPAGAVSVSYWNKRMMDGPMISMKDGLLLHPKVVLHRAEALRTSTSGPAVADHYTVSGAFDADVWYDQTDTWLGLAIPVADGSVVRYERVAG